MVEFGVGHAGVEGEADEAVGGLFGDGAAAGGDASVADGRGGVVEGLIVVDGAYAAIAEVAQKSVSLVGIWQQEMVKMRRVDAVGWYDGPSYVVVARPGGEVGVVRGPDPVAFLLDVTESFELCEQMSGQQVGWEIA